MFISQRMLAHHTLLLSLGGSIDGDRLSEDGKRTPLDVGRPIADEGRRVSDNTAKPVVMGGGRCQCVVAAWAEMGWPQRMLCH